MTVPQSQTDILSSTLLSEEAVEYIGVYNRSIKQSCFFASTQLMSHSIQSLAQLLFRSPIYAPTRSI